MTKEQPCHRRKHVGGATAPGHTYSRNPRSSHARANTTGPSPHRASYLQVAKLGHRSVVDLAAVWRDRRARLLCRGCGSRRGACWLPNPRRLTRHTWLSVGSERSPRPMRGLPLLTDGRSVLPRPSVPRSQAQAHVRMSTALRPKRSRAVDGVGDGRRAGPYRPITVDGAGHSPACSRLSVSPPRARARVATSRRKTVQRRSALAMRGSLRKPVPASIAARSRRDGRLQYA